MYNKERTLKENWVIKIRKNIVTVNKTKRSLNSFDDKGFCVNNIERYPHDNDLYAFENDLINKAINAPLKLLINFCLIEDKNLLIENIKELTINDERELIFADITVYIDLP